MEFVNEVVERDDYVLVKQKNNFWITEYQDNDFQSKKQLNTAQSKRLIGYYIKMAQRLRERYNKEKISDLLQSILIQQMYSKIVETDEANDIARIGKYSFNSLGDEEIDVDFSDMDESFDKNKEIKFKIPDYSQAIEICKNIDQLVDSLLNIVIPGVESIEFSTAHSSLESDATVYSKNVSFFDETIYDLSVRLVKPAIIDKMLSEPLKIVLNSLRIDDEGFLYSPQFSFFNDLQQIFKKLNIQIEVKSLQLNVHFKQRFPQKRDAKISSFFNSYKNFLKKVTIEMEWIFTQQILEVYMQFNNDQQQHIQQQITQTLGVEHKSNELQDQNKLDLSTYSLKILLHHPLNAAIVNDIKINIVNHQPGQFIKKIYYSNELTSNLFQYLGQNNNVAFIHTQQFCDSRAIKYIRYKSQKNQKLKNKFDNNQPDFNYHSSSFSEKGSDLSYNSYDSGFSNFDAKSQSLSLEGIDIDEHGVIPKYKHKTLYNIFDIYKNLLEVHLSKQTFVFCSFDIHSHVFQKLSKQLSHPIDIGQMILNKTTTILSLYLYNRDVSDELQYKPDQIIWDLYL